MSVIAEMVPPLPERLKVSVWRQRSGALTGTLETYIVEVMPGDHVLNLLWRLRRLVDPTLIFPDHFCKVGTCGACALTVDGRPSLACRTIVRDGTVIHPPKGKAVVADLMTNSNQSRKDVAT